MVPDPLLILSIVVSTFASCAAIAGWIATAKRRSTFEGILLGLFLGPIGVLIEIRHDYVRRPMVDQKAFHSLRSMMTYQQSDGRSKRS